MLTLARLLRGKRGIHRSIYIQADSHHCSHAPQSIKAIMDITSNVCAASFLRGSNACPLALSRGLRSILQPIWHSLHIFFS